MVMTVSGGESDTPVSDQFIHRLDSMYEDGNQEVLAEADPDLIQAFEREATGFDLSSDREALAHHFRNIIAPGAWLHHDDMGSFFTVREAGKEVRPRHNTTIVHVRKDENPPAHVHKGTDVSRRPAEITGTFRGALVKHRKGGLTVVIPSTIAVDSNSSIDIYLPQAVLPALNKMLPGVLPGLGVREEDIGNGWLGIYHQSGGSSVRLVPNQVRMAQEALDRIEVTLGSLGTEIQAAIAAQRTKLASLIQVS